MHESSLYRAYPTYPDNNDNGVRDVSRDVIGGPIAEAVMELVSDNSSESLVVVRNDAEELRSWLLKRMEIMRYADMAGDVVQKRKLVETTQVFVSCT